MIMKQLSLLSCLLLCVLNGLSAQTSPNDSIAKAQVREIKLSERYIHAEAISPAGFYDATAAALDELRVNVAYMETDQGKGKEETQATLQRLDSLCRKITYKQMSMFKAFVYVSLNALAGIPEEPAPTAAAPSETATVPSDTAAVSSEPPAEVPQPEAPALAADSIAPDTPAEAEFTVPDTVPDTTPDTAPDTALVAVADTITDSVTDTVADTTPVIAPDTVAVAPAVKAPAATPQAEALPADTLPEKHQRVIGDLLALDTYEGVMLYLNAMKEDGRLMYGKMSALRRPEEAYLIIVKDGQLLTILDRGDNPRTNLKTRQPEDLRKYKGHAVIWLKVF